MLDFYQLEVRWEVSLIPEHIIEKIKEQNDIVDVISEVVKLKRSGRNYTGLCPFHREKTPSFSVSSDKQIFKCFGCGEAGNVFSFVMKYRNMSYIDAVKYLADRANITIEEKGSSKKLHDKKEILYNLNKEVARFFFNNLYKYDTGKNYFNIRGIDEKTIRRFGLGYSLNSWNSVMQVFRRKYGEELLLEAGLVLKSEKGTVYDRFRNRVMFPVFDYKGRVIGFGGRVLDDSKPKYLNSPETLIFNKGTNLYGLNFAIKNSNTRTFIIVEGYMDVISLHQHGITNAVASLGTALTVNQARLLKRYADKVIISYDADVAGQMATLRGLEILRTNGFDVRVLTVPNGKDPDEFIRNNGKEAFQKLMDSALPLIDYRLNRAKEGINFKNRDMVISYVKKVTDILTSLDSIEKDVYIKKISEESGIGENAIYDLLNENIQKATSNYENMNTTEGFRQKLYVEPAYIKAERNLLKLLVQNDTNCYDYICSNINESDFVMDAHRFIFKLILECEDKKDLKERESYIDNKCNTSTDLIKEWVNINDTTIIYEEDQIMSLIDDYINEISNFKTQNDKKNLIKLIKDLEEAGKFEEALQYASKLKDLQKKS